MADSTAMCCEICDVVDGVNWYCQDCEQRLCDQCRKHHLRNKKTRSDDVIPLNGNKKVYTSQTTCTSHQGKVLDLFCESCYRLICVKCLSDSHKKHDWCTVDEYKSKKRNEISSKTDDCRDLLERYKSVLNDDKKVTAFYLHCLDQLKQDIVNRAARICEETNKIRDEYLEEINTLSIVAKEQQDEKFMKMKTDMLNMDTVISVADQELKTGESVFTLTELWKNLEARVKSCQCPQVTEKQPPLLEKENYGHTKLLSLFGKLKYQPATQTESVIYEVKVRTLKTKSQKKILSLCVLDNGNIWISFDGDRFLVLIDEYIQVIKRSCNTEREVVNMAIYKNKELVFTRFMDTHVQKLVSNGEKMTTIADLDPYYAKGVCVQEDGTIVVCCVLSTGSVQNGEAKSKVIKLTGSGQTLLEVTTNKYDTEMLTLPYRITTCSSGEIFLTDLGKTDRRVTCLDQQGDRLFSWSWRGEGVGIVDPLGITSDDKACYITDEINNQIYVLPKTGLTASVLLNDSSRDSGPRCITLDKSGRLFVGCKGGVILIIEK